MSDVTAALEDLLVLLLAALLPALIWLIYVRNSERYEREPWSRLLGAFAWGALFATIVAGILEAILVSAGNALEGNAPGPEFVFLRSTSPWNVFFVVLIVAPFVEEAMKAAGTSRSLGPIRSVADGPVVGASVGLGFGFFETFLYGLGAFIAGGLIDGLFLILVRSVSSVLLHGSSTAMFGYGLARGRLSASGTVTAAYYLLAVTMHATFNLLASLGALLPLVGITAVDSATASLIGFLAAMAFAGTALQHVRSVITASSYPGATGGHPRFRPPPAVRRRTGP